MSIILEALRKADAARTREAPPPALASTNVVPLRATSPPRPRGVPRTPLVLAGVGALAAALGGLAVFLVVGGDEPAPPERTAAASAEPPAPTTEERQVAGRSIAPAPVPPRPEPEVRGLALEARAARAPAAPPPEPRHEGGSVVVQDLLGLGDGPAETAPAHRPGTVEVRDLLGEEGGAEPVAPPAAGDPEAERAALENKERGLLAEPPTERAAPAAPSLNELVASGQLNPPEINLDMHAWAPDPKERFVYINMRRYRIGDTTREGATVENITPDGVVLLLQGRRFILPAR
jgi:general secretion pathway protein B